MLKRLSSLALVLVVGGSVMAATARVRSEHVCKMAGMEMMSGMETMPCGENEQPKAVTAEPSAPGQCCFTIPQEAGSSETAFNLRVPSFSVAVIHPGIVQSSITIPKPYEHSYSRQLFLPNLQTSYIRNLSLLI